MPNPLIGFSLITGIACVAVIVFGFGALLLNRNLEEPQCCKKDDISDYYSNNKFIECYDTNKKKKKREEEICSICLENLSNSIHTTPLNCGHVFHEKCFNDYRKNYTGGRTLSCPICRRSI